MMCCYPLKQIPKLLRWGDFIWRQLIWISIPKTISKRSIAGQLEWMCVVRPPTDKPPQAKVFLAVGVEAFVPDCLLDGTGPRWRCGERRKTMRWASVVRAQMQLLVVTYRCSNGRTQAAGVYRIDGMSARRPPCRVCLAGSMPG